MSYEEEHPYCFGDMDTVFPMGQDGLRHSPESCMLCYCKTDCMRAALHGSSGTAVEEEKVDRAYESGMMGFFERWSKKKALHRDMQKKRSGT
ncbi:MAG: hypothetical protein V2I97_18725 [Desulfococcaceae bacterium]|jgi:hypothetical protein|nr:hypothetical protein [Desulfococcaceae bacterium]